MHRSRSWRFRELPHRCTRTLKSPQILVASVVAFDQPRAAHAWHDDVCDHDIDFARMLVGNGQCLKSSSPFSACNTVYPSLFSDSAASARSGASSSTKRMVPYPFGAVPTSRVVGK